LKVEFTSKDAAGLTVNERLWLSGQMEAFDNAIAETDEAEFRRICKSVFLDENNIRGLMNKYFGD